MTTASVPNFHGIPPTGIQFLRDLRQNNNKQWFEEHSATYTESVQGPALALVVALGEKLQSDFPEIRYDARTNGGSLMRIYRDTRFSADKSPYKTNLAMMFTPAGYKRMEAPGFGLQITPDQVELVAGIFSFDPPMLEAYRTALLDDVKGQEVMEAIAQVLSVDGYTLGGKDLKRVPRGYDEDHPRTEWLKYKGLHAFAPPIPIEVAHSPDLPDVVMAHFRHMAPIYRWLVSTFAIA